MLGDSSGPHHFYDWHALTPAQRSALMWQIAHQARAARAHAMSEAVRSSVRWLLGSLASAFAAAGLPASERRWH